MMKRQTESNSVDFRKQTQCPTITQLETFILEKVSKETRRNLEHHLIACEHCRGLVTGLYANPTLSEYLPRS